MAVPKTLRCAALRQWLAQGVKLLIGFGLATVAFAMVCRLMAHVRVGWRDVFLGAVVSALLITVGCEGTASPSAQSTTAACGIRVASRLTTSIH